jgi:hypothetical protein
VLPSEGRDTVGLILFGVTLVPDSEISCVYQAGHAGQHLLTIQTLAPQVVTGGLPHLGQVVGKAQDALELLPLLALAIPGVVEILEPARRVVADGLNLCGRTAGYVNLLPGRRHLKVLDTRQDLLLAYSLAGIRVAVEKPLLL